MKLLYEKSPRQFEEFLASIVKKSDIIVGPTFTQQTKQEKSIPDLVITQKSFSVFFEVKTTDWFTEDQITRHLDGLVSFEGEKILFLLSNFDGDNLEKQFSISIDLARQRNITLLPLTFEDLVDALDKVCHDEYLRNLLEEFQLYLDGNGHLPTWKYLLDVVNCKGTMQEIDQGVYMCPATGGAYSHRRARFFGPYADKEVSRIFEIKAIVIVDKDLRECNVIWNNTHEAKETLIQQAMAKLQTWPGRIDENKTVPLQVFLLDKPEVTKFKKETSGGMLQSKKYFWDIAKGCQTSKELADKLNGKSWSEYDRF